MEHPGPVTARSFVFFYRQMGISLYKEEAARDEPAGGLLDMSWLRRREPGITV
jgi:hypothetical protein